MPSLGKLIRRWNRTALSLGLPGDLSLSAWLTTLEYFQFQCAYCNGPYENMDHFIPQRLQGPTGIDNCLPSCFSCNKRKAGAHPDDCRWIEEDTLARLHAYLDPLVVQAVSRRQQVNEMKRHEMIANTILHNLTQYCQMRGHQDAGMRRNMYLDIFNRLGADKWQYNLYYPQDMQDLLDECRRVINDHDSQAVCQYVEQELLRLCNEAAFPPPIHTDPATHSIFWW